MMPPQAAAVNSNGTSIWKTRWISVFLLIADTIGLSLCWLGAWYFRVLMTPILGPINTIDPYLAVYPLVLLAGLANCMAFGLYLHRRRLSSLNRPSILIRAGYHWLLYIIVIGFFFKEMDLGRSIILLAAILGQVHLFLSRGALKYLKGRAITAGRGTMRCAIVGTSSLALEVRESLRQHPEVGYTLAGMISHPGDEPAPNLDEVGIRLLGTASELDNIAEQENLEEIFLAVAHLDAREQLDLLNLADRRGLNVHVVTNIFGVITEQAKVGEIGAYPVITLRDGYVPLHQDLLKRTLDLACAGLGFLVWMVFFHWWISWRIMKDSPGPIFFRQERVGKNGTTFEIVKYRTMRTEADPYGFAPTQDDDPRVTPFGRWLRRTSLDEMPQLLNVLKGEMSMVGPRPEMPFIVEKYEPWQRRRLDVKPGVTGLWQVIGRKNLPLHLNMQYDFYYIKNQSFLLDVEIILRTIPAVLHGKGAF
ncbi:MAG: sugar transferase [Candidatus Sumerlaeia bacterium]|nr:sugar transferase [Candidatus Sumerlaeia bacterium]